VINKKGDIIQLKSTCIKNLKQALDNINLRDYNIQKIRKIKI
jgi:hypothetical protein